MPVFERLLFFRVSSENFPAKGFKILPIENNKPCPAKLGLGLNVDQEY